MKNSLRDKLVFWLWHKEIAMRMDRHPATAYMWQIRVEAVYKPLFEKRGLHAVIDEHNKYVARLKKSLLESE